MSFTLIEPCAGSAALTFHLLGARKALLPYQGSKWRFRRALASLVHELAGIRLTHVVLTDPGPWGTALGQIFNEAARKEVVGKLEAYAAVDPRKLFECLQGEPVPSDALDFTVQFLFLQRLAFSGKAVGVVNGKWSSPGFNGTSAYGTPATERFGAVRPMVPSLVRTLRGLELTPCVVTGRQTTAGVPDPSFAREGRIVVYLDPVVMTLHRFAGNRRSGSRFRFDR